MKFEDEDFLSAEEREAIKAGPRTFAPAEMSACARCGRNSPPTRMSCLYCGAALAVAEGARDLRRPALRPLEDWERGLVVVLLPRARAPEDIQGEATAATRVGVAESDGKESDDEETSGSFDEASASFDEAAESDGEGAKSDDEEAAGLLDEAALAEAAALVRLAPGELREFLSAGVPLPVARTGEPEEAALLERKLGALGLRVALVADEELAVEENPPRRVRQLDFGETEVVGRTAGGEESAAAWDELELLVAGRVHLRRIETEERRVRGGARELAESREFQEDEAVLDLYFAGSRANWRVAAEGFDYSCLGARKGLTAAENFARLAGELRRRAPRARYDGVYRRVRHLLKFAWPPREHTEAGGLRRLRPGKFRPEAVTVVSNETQFTRYGRLLRRFTPRAR